MLLVFSEKRKKALTAYIETHPGSSVYFYKKEGQAKGAPSLSVNIIYDDEAELTTLLNELNRNVTGRAVKIINDLLQETNKRLKSS